MAYRESETHCHMRRGPRRPPRASRLRLMFILDCDHPNMPVPPGIKESGNLNAVHNGGHVETWLDYDKVKLYTNAFILEEGRVSTFRKLYLRFF